MTPMNPLSPRPSRRRIVRRSLLFLICVCLCSSVAMISARAADWPYWRGPLKNGFSPEKDLPAKFDVDKPGKDNLVWQAKFGCRATPLVFNGRVYLNGPVGEKKTSQERVVCLDEKTGGMIWE